MANFLASEKRLKIGRLPGPVRRYTFQLVIVGLIACLIIILVGLGIYPSDTALQVPEYLSPIHGSIAVPFSLVVFLLIGLGILASALVYSSYQDKGIKPLLTRIITGFLSVLLPVNLWQDWLLPIGSEGIGFLLLPIYIQLGLTLLALACGAATFILAFFSSPRAAWWAPRFAAGSFFNVLLAFVAQQVFWYFLAPESLINELNVQLIVLQFASLVLFTSPLVLFVSVIFFWQAITEVKFFSREIGTFAANLSGRFPGLVVILFAVKIIWLFGVAAGLLGAQARAVWERTAQDGPIEWILAFLFAAAAGRWLIRLSKMNYKERLLGSASFLTGGFFLPFILSFIVFVFASLVILFEGSHEIQYSSLVECFSSSQGSFGTGLACLSNALAGVGLVWQIAFIAILLPLGLLLLRFEKSRHLAPIFLLTGLWSLPVVLQLIFPDLELSFGYLTFDIVFTFVLLLTAVLAWQKQQLGVYHWRIVLMLSVSTLVALAETLVPSNLVYIAGYLLLVIPFLYQLVFNSSELNAAGESQVQKVIQTIGFQVLLMVIVAWAFATGWTSPDQDDFEIVANRIFLPPLLGLYLASMIADKTKDDVQVV